MGWAKEAATGTGCLPRAVAEGVASEEALAPSGHTRMALAAVEQAGRAADAEAEDEVAGSSES